MMKDPSKGFTLLETLVAVSIVALAVTGPLYTASRSIVAAETARDQLTASYLAQEGIEYVRAMRDDEYITWYRNDNIALAWSRFLTSNDASAITQCKEGTLCALDATKPLGSTNDGSYSRALEVCDPGACRPLYPLASSDNAYSWDGDTNYPGTTFTRTVTAYAVSPTEERIVSTVTWSFHEIPYTVTVTDHLTPWQ